MSTDQVQLERRGAQRFDFHLPVGIRSVQSTEEGCGFTQDLSARGALLYTDFSVGLGDSVELTLVMPSEITLAENMRVRCRGKVVRRSEAAAGSKPAVAVHLEGYEFLPDAEPAATQENYRRVSSLHPSEGEAKVIVRPVIHS
ncbi:MAG TPA: PilZ domain-containing protein [Terriglobales bacterium]|nr:PilZ domain-containing protein [Terriglobales bacterium]